MQQPFFIGQEVVALKDDFRETKRYKKGQIFIVLDTNIFCKHGQVLDLGFRDESNLSVCKSCKFSIATPIVWVGYTSFAPVTRLRISDKLTIAEGLGIESVAGQVEERADYVTEKIEVYE